jgi:hypothetical protein
VRACANGSGLSRLNLLLHAQPPITALLLTGSERPPLLVVYYCACSYSSASHLHDGDRVLHGVVVGERLERQRGRGEEGGLTAVDLRAAPREGGAGRLETVLG